jgi:hypothetical protein
MEGICIFCGQKGNYAGGLVIRGRLICGGCEKRLVSTGSGNLFYDLYVKGLKKIWRCRTA